MAAESHETHLPQTVDFWFGNIFFPADQLHFNPDYGKGAKNTYATTHTHYIDLATGYPTLYYTVTDKSIAIACAGSFPKNPTEENIVNFTANIAQHDPRILTFDIQALSIPDRQRYPGLFGKDFYNSVIKHLNYYLGVNAPTTVEDLWTPASDNYQTYKKLTSAGMPRNQAALATWSGKTAHSNGFVTPECYLDLDAYVVFKFHKGS